MKGRTLVGVAWSLWGTTMVMLAATVAFNESVVARDAPALLAVVVMATVGAVVASRARNAIGWIFLGLGLWWSLSGLAEVALEVTGTAGLLEFAEWQSHWTWAPVVLVPPTFVLLLFPDGRLPSSRWRAIAWASGLGAAAFIFEMAFGQYLGGTEEYGPNPYYLRGLSEAISFGIILLVPALIGSVASVIVRFRRASARAPTDQAALLRRGDGGGSDRHGLARGGDRSRDSGPLGRCHRRGRDHA
ncbi:MAG: hypothetical protein ABR592_07685, partial [Nitriliruptorales bacterium]